MPTIGVEVVVIEAGKVLLTLREDVPLWCLPGGHVEAGESVAQTAVREAREETGVEIELLRLVGVYSRPTWARGGDHNIIFAARPVGGRLQPQAGEALAVRYFAPDALPPNLFWWQRQRIADAWERGTAVVWRQDTLWPFGDTTPDDLRRAKRQGQPHAKLT